MLEARQRLIDLATRPLAGNQTACDLAQGELMDRLAHARPADGDDLLEEATRRLEDIPPRAPWQSALGFAAALALSGAILFPVLRAAWQEMKELNPVYGFITFDYTHDEEWEARITDGLDAEKRAFLLANTQGFAHGAQAIRYAEASKRFPEDPADFEEFLAYLLTTAANRQRTDCPPSPGLMDHARRIDPGNGWWTLAGAELAYTSGYRWDSQQKRSDWISNELERGAREPRYASHLPGRTVRRLEMLAPVSDIASMVSRQRFASRQRNLDDPSQSNIIWNGREMELRYTSLKRLIATWEDHVRRQLQPEQGAVLDSEVIFKIRQVSGTFFHGATRKGLPDEAARMDRWTKEAADILSRTPSLGPRRYAMTVSGSRQDFIADVAEFEPGRRAEFALADRFFALTAACCFVVFAFLAALETWRRPEEIRGMALGLSPLFRPVDFAWLAGLGLAVPLAWHVLITRFTPLGCRDFAMTEWGMIPSFAQAGGSLLFATCMLLQTARWRLAKRAGILALRPQLLWPGWGAAAVAAVFAPCLGIVQYLTKWQEEFLLLGSTAAGIPLLWLLWRGGAIAFGPRSGSLGGVLTCRLVFPAFLAMAALLLALMPLLKSEERRWVARDTVGGTDPAGSGLGRLEARTQAALRQQLLDAMK